MGRSACEVTDFCHTVLPITLQGMSRATFEQRESITGGMEEYFVIKSNVQYNAGDQACHSARAAAPIPRQRRLPSAHSRTFGCSCADRRMLCTKATVVWDCTCAIRKRVVASHSALFRSSMTMRATRAGQVRHRRTYAKPNKSIADCQRFPLSCTHRHARTHARTHRHTRTLWIRRK